MLTSPSFVFADFFIESHLEKDETAEPQHLCLHGAIKVAFLPEVNGGEDVSQPNQPAPHTMTPLHVEDELELWKRHVMVHTGKNMIKTHES